MDKNLEAELSLIIELNWKTTTTHLMTPMNVKWSMLKSSGLPLLLFCEIKLIYLYKCVHGYHQK
jgi:hypothetical protein